MSIREERREASIGLLADHILRAGLAGSSLRQLAVATGTSDRMLLYYFASKDELLAVTLARIAQQLATFLDEAIPSSRKLPSSSLMTEIWRMMKTRQAQPYVRLWLELTAGAARGVQPHRLIAGRIADTFLRWVMDHLDAKSDADRSTSAVLLLATVEGLLVLDSVGRRKFSDAAALGFSRR